MNTSSSKSQNCIVGSASVEHMRETIRRKGQLKGRQADEVSLEEVRALIGEAPHRRDWLIEHLHKLNDAYRCLHDRHLVALAKEMKLPMAEVFEVATFYHHFEVVRGDEAAPRFDRACVRWLELRAVGCQTVDREVARPARQCRCASDFCALRGPLRTSPRRRGPSKPCATCHT